MSQAVRKSSVSLRHLGVVMTLTLFFVGTVTCSALPDMQSVVKPSPEPSAQTGWDTFTPPVSGSPAANTPLIAEWTRTGISDDTLALTGDALSAYSSPDDGKDAEFLFYGQTTSVNGVQSAASIQRLDGVKAAVTLPAGLPAWSTYLMWPRNGYGYGYPVAVNRTESWWLGPNDKVTRGDTVSVYGRNLSKSNGTTSSWVYVKPAASAGWWAEIVSVNPYRVQFRVPDSCTNGTYEVWMHNGHGGSYGWSGPLSLVVTDAYPWSGSTFNVMTYGAAGDGVTDDTAAFDAAWTAAWNYAFNYPQYGATIYMPAGTYMTHHCINPASNVRWMGAGMNSTILKANATMSNGLIYTTGAWNNSDVRDLTLDGNGYVSNYVASLNFNVGASDVRFTNVRFRELAGTNLVYLGNPMRTFFTGCEFIGGRGLYIVGSHQVHFKDCDYWGMNGATGFIYAWSSGEFSMTGCTAQDYDISQASGCFQGRLLAGASVYGSFRNVYVGDCVTADLGPHVSAAEQNCGEQIMCESNGTLYEGNPASATSTTVTFSDTGTLDIVNQVAVIINGKGMGQYRTITAYNSGTKTITVSPAWNVVPDTGSKILLARGASKWAIYNNYLDGKNDWTTRPKGAGIDLYGGCYDWVGANNTVTNTYMGAYLAGIQQASPTSINPTYFNYFTGNLFQSSHVGLFTTTSVPAVGTEYGPGLLGNVFRNNQVSSITTLGVLMNGATPSTPGYRYNTNIFEHNTFTDLPKGIDCDESNLSLRSRNTVLYKNSFSLGTATYSGSYGVEFGSNSSLPDLRQNTWTGFATTYAGSTPGAILEVPTRKFDVAGTVGGANQTANLTIWNAGTASLAWSATSDSSWLTLSSSSGSISNENSSSSVTLTCNPTVAGSGTYVGTVTITGASQTKKVVVTFTVTGGALPFSDDFNNGSIGSAWTTIGGTWTESGGIFSQTSTASGDPKKAILSNAGAMSTDHVVMAKVMVDSWTGGSDARAGLGIRTDASNGRGYNLLFHTDNNTVQFLNDYTAWGNSYSFAWTTGTWYWFKLKIEGEVLYGKIWKDGDPEPGSWPYSQSGWSNHPTGYPALNGGCNASATVSFDDFTATSTSYSNTAPSCSITSPSGGFSSSAPATINITASSSDTEGYVSKVEFYNNGILLGTDTSSSGGWTYSWTNVEASGSSGISLTAKAYDNQGATTVSSGVTGTVTDSALKCYWKLDSTSGTSCTDSSGTGNTGTTYSSPTWVAGKVLNCLNFNGTSQYAADTSTTGLPAANANQTVSCWMYVPTNPTVRKTAVCLTATSGNGTYMGFLTSTTFGVWRYNAVAIVTTTSLPSAGAWHHVAYVLNGSNKYLYIDGAQAATSTASPNTYALTRIHVGRTAAGGDYWPGMVDEVRVYNRVLSSTEIAALAAGKQ